MKKIALIIGTGFLPLIALAQNAESAIQTVARIIGLLAPIFITLAILAFFWGIVRYLWGGAEDKAQAVIVMVWGVVAIFVMISIYGLVRFIGNTFGIQQQGSIQFPQVNPRGNY